MNDDIQNRHAAVADLPIAERDLDDLHSRLESSALQQDIVDVGYRVVDTEIGRLLLAATTAGLVRVAFEREGFDAVLDDLARRVSSRILCASTMLDDAATQLGEYFGGTRHEFSLPLDYRLSSGFRQQVQRSLPTIGYGHTVTYAQLAHQVGNPKAVRAVGTACATNPLPVVVPCHRVLRTDGTLGGYLGGVEVKSALLEMERAA